MGDLRNSRTAGFEMLFREDPDYIFRSTVANYTLSALQLAQIFVQVRETEENPEVLPHLVSSGYLKERQMDAGKCRRFLVSVPGYGNIPLFAPECPCPEAFPKKEELVSMVRARTCRLDTLARDVERRTGKRMVMTDIETEKGRKWFYLDSLIMVRKGISLMDFVYSLQTVCLQDSSEGQTENATTDLAKKLLNVFWSVPDPLDLGRLFELPDEELFRAYEEALDRFREVMFSVAPIFTLNELIAILEAWQLAMNRRDLAESLGEGQERLKKKLLQLDAGAAGLLISCLKQGHLRYTPAVIL